MRNLSRYGFRASFFSKTEFNLIQRQGTKEAWLRAADLTCDPAKWRDVLNALRPWTCSPPNLCGVYMGKIALISKVYVRIPDAINRLTEPEIADLQLDPKLNPFNDKTEWIYLKGNDPVLRSVFGYSQKRAYGAPRKKVLPFE